MNKKLFRITTVPESLDKLLENQMQYMSPYYAVTAISSDAPNLEIVGMRQGVSVFNVEMTRKITPLHDLKAVWHLYQFFKKEKPFIVHTHTPKAGTVGMLAAKLARVPNRLHTIAGLPLLEARGPKRKLLNLVEKVTYYCATKVYPNSHGLKAIIVQEQFCKPDKLQVIGNGSSNGINTSHFDPSRFSEQEKAKLKSELGIRSEDFVFVFVGRLVGDKGVNELVTAFQKVQTLEMPAKLVLVGPQENDLDPLRAETLKGIHSNPNIIVVGFQNDVRPYFALSDVLVFPSYREGFPNVVMQAGAMGLPSIVSNINGCNEIIENGVNGIIIPVKDETAIFEAMKKIIVEPVLLAEMKRNARDRIVSRFEQAVVWEAILKEYKKLELHV